MEINFSDRLIAIRVNADVKNRNDGQGRHWSASSKAKSRLFAACKSAEFSRWCPEDEHWMPADIHQCKLPSRSKVNIVATRVLGPKQRLWDADSILRGEFKQLLDSLVQLGIIEDDGPKYVDYVIGDQDHTRRQDGPAFELVFYRA